MTNVVPLHAGRRWKAVVEYDIDHGSMSLEHYLDDLEAVAQIIERGPNPRSLLRCTITLNRPENG